MAKRHVPPWMGLGELFEARERLRDLRRTGEGSACGLWAPATDVYETTAGYVIEMDLPGIAQEDVILEVSGGGLTVSGQRPRLTGKAASFHALERDCGPFSRSFGLPRDADPEAISASMKNGVLTISIPRKGDEPKRSIQVD